MERERLEEGGTLEMAGAVYESWSNFEALVLRLALSPLYVILPS